MEFLNIGISGLKTQAKIVLLRSGIRADTAHEVGGLAYFSSLLPTLKHGLHQGIKRPCINRVHAGDYFLILCGSL